MEKKWYVYAGFVCTKQHVREQQRIQIICKMEDDVAERKEIMHERSAHQSAVEKKKKKKRFAK